MEQHELFKSIYNSNLKSRAINVMSCLITYMNTKDNTCFPAIKTIAKCCSMGVSTVKRALADLVEAGFVVKEPRFIEAKNMAQTSNLYRLSAVFTAPEPLKDKETVQPIYDGSADECTTVTFEDLKNESISNANTNSISRNLSAACLGLPKTTPLPHKNQLFFAGVFSPFHKWTALQSIKVPP